MRGGRTIRGCLKAWMSVALCGLALCLSACAEVRERPDLPRLYAGARSAEVPPVILVHGVFGAKLRNADGKEIWPDGLRGLAFSNYRHLALDIDERTLAPVDDGVVPYDIFDEAGGLDFYGAMLRTLETAGGYRRGVPGTPAVAGERRYYLFLYDWRRDNIDSVRGLDALIERIRADYGRPDLRVDLIGHSNGGLIARYYERYGTADLLDGNDFPVTHAGAAKLRRMILLGTPNFGAIDVAKSFIEGQRVGLRRIPPEVFATTPSAYELLPHALNDWLLDENGKPLKRDLFDIEIWRRFEWGVFDPEVRARVVAASSSPAEGAHRLAVLERFFGKQLERGRRFSWSLSVDGGAGGVRPVLLGGDCDLTPARLLVEDVDGESYLRMWPGEIEHPRPGIDYGRLMLEPGDGRVTKASLLARESLDPTVPRHRWSHFDYDYVFFLCERHDRLTGNPSFEDNLLHALLSVDR